jgi:osmoprotectant transport system permease protein
MFSPRIKTWIPSIILAGIFIFLIVNMNFWQKTLGFLFPQYSVVIYPNASLLELTLQHLELVAISSLLTILIGVPLAIWVTRTSGRDFLPIVAAATSFGQTFPPVAVLALAVPALGFGVLPTVVALFLYGLLPVVRNTIAGIQSVPPSLLDAGYGMGMNPFQALTRVEIPLAMPVILAGIRISVIINIGTAMIGATIGSGGLGTPVISGLIQKNVAFIIEGAVPAALLAILVDQVFSNIEKNYANAVIG